MSFARRHEWGRIGWILTLCSAAAWADGAPAPEATARRPLEVIELPADGPRLPGSGRGRPHHALSIAAEAPRLWLRSLGLDATDCATRLRLPSRIKPARESGARVEVKAQIGLSCRF
jgi:hypothetical protein